jgi:hypothetical protein
MSRGEYNPIDSTLPKQSVRNGLGMRVTRYFRTRIRQFFIKPSLYFGPVRMQNPPAPVTSHLLGLTAGWR